jgi:carboxyl-terminal processing protease
MENKGRYTIYLPIAFALVLILGMFLGSKLILVSSSNGSLSNRFFSFGSNKYDKLNDVINYIESSYVDSVSKEDLIEKALSGLLTSLDPHSSYIPAAEFNEANDPIQGNFDGIGVEFRVIRDTVVVINTIDKGPSQKKGVNAGDRIVKVNGKNIASIKIKDDEVKKLLKGKKGTDVKITVYRSSNKKLLDFTITRDAIPTFSIDVNYIATGNIGYIKLSKFSTTTFNEFDEALISLKRNGMKKLILDLRGNGGGLLNSAVNLADEFLTNKKLIVYTEGRNKPKEYYNATEKGLFQQGEVVILIDEFSASASEILAGAIQDNDRGTIIGRRSFGKGLVQEQVSLNDGSAVRLTVSRYYTPTGRCIQNSYKDGSDEYYNSFYERFYDGELESVDSIKFPDSLKYKTPKGKIVYGGGGIMPDIFVPLGKEERTKLYIDLMNKGIFQQFAFEYTDKKRNALKILYKNSNDFIKSFNVSNQMLNEFFLFAIKNGIKDDDKNANLSEEIIKAYIKGYIGRNLFDDAGFYPIINSVDKTYLKAIEVLKQK